MEILFAIVIAAGIGLVLRYLLPGRDRYGMLLAPGIAAIVTGAVWALLVWLGWTFDGGWIWLVGLAAGGLAALVAVLALPRARDAADAEFFEQARRAV